VYTNPAKEIVAIFYWYPYTFSKNDVISSVQKRYCALGLELKLGLRLAEIHFQASVVEPFLFVPRYSIFIDMLLVYVCG